MSAPLHSSEQSRQPPALILQFTGALQKTPKTKQDQLDLGARASQGQTGACGHMRSEELALRGGKIAS
jgi:hypothetical protein